MTMVKIDVAPSGPRGAADPVRAFGVPHGAAGAAPAARAVHASDGIRSLRPGAPLASCVDHYWFSAHASAPVTTLGPVGRVDVVLARTAGAATVSVYGSVTARTEVALEPGATYIGVQFRAGRARHFLDVPTHELTDCVLPGRDALTFALERALDAPHPLDAIAAIDAALLQHLAHVQPCAARIDRLVASLEATHGGLRIADLARQFGLSRRQVERAFIDDVGLAPKVFASIQRFSYAAA